MAEVHLDAYTILYTGQGKGLKITEFPVAALPKHISSDPNASESKPKLSAFLVMWASVT